VRAVRQVSNAAMTNTPPSLLERPSDGRPTPDRRQLAGWVTGARERAAGWWRGLGAADRLWWVVASAIVAAGLGAEVRVWASDRDFGGDEIYIADNLAASAGAGCSACSGTTSSRRQGGW
jgi:hypothetical protein